MYLDGFGKFVKIFVQKYFLPLLKEKSQKYNFQPKIWRFKWIRFETPFLKM